LQKCPPSPTSKFRCLDSSSTAWQSQTMKHRLNMHSVALTQAKPMTPSHPLCFLSKHSSHKVVDKLGIEKLALQHQGFKEDTSRTCRVQNRGPQSLQLHHSQCRFSWVHHNVALWLSTNTNLIMSVLWGCNSVHAEELHWSQTSVSIPRLTLLQGSHLPSMSSSSILHIRQQSSQVAEPHNQKEDQSHDQFTVTGQVHTS